MGGPTEDLKQRHEKAVCERLLKGVREAGKIENAKLLGMGNANNREPDCLWRVDCKLVGIEVATAYYSEDDACLDWEHARRQKCCSMSGISEPDTKICKTIQRELDDKCEKQYGGADQVWLCIDVDAPLGDQESMDACLDRLCVPNEHHFHRIYLLHYAPAVAGVAGTQQAGDKVVELYPQRGRWFASSAALT